jgi:hypothetical protein
LFLVVDNNVGASCNFGQDDIASDQFIAISALPSNKQQKISAECLNLISGMTDLSG